MFVCYTFYIYRWIDLFRKTFFLNMFIYFIHMCEYIYIYTHTHAHTHILYIHIYIEREREREREFTSKIHNSLPVK